MIKQLKRVIRKTSDIVTLNFWQRLSPNETPFWVRLVASKKWLKQLGKGARDRIFYINGKTFIYKVIFIVAGQGMADIRFYKKLKTF